MKPLPSFAPRRRFNPPFRAHYLFAPALHAHDEARSCRERFSDIIADAGADSAADDLGMRITGHIENTNRFYLIEGGVLANPLTIANGLNSIPPASTSN
jgi:hypothetical protein